MAKSEKKEQEVVEKIDPVKEETVEDKLKISQDKLLRAMAEMENQRRRFEKEKQEAFEFGGFNFARESLSLLDNVDRAINSFKNDESLNDFGECFLIFFGNRLHISLYFPSLLVPIIISLIFSILD